MHQISPLRHIIYIKNKCQHLNWKNYPKVFRLDVTAVFCECIVAFNDRKIAARFLAANKNKVNSDSSEIQSALCILDRLIDLRGQASPYTTVVH